MDFVDDSDDGVDYEQNTQREHCTIIAKIHNFSNENIHQPGQISSDCTDYEVRSQFRTYHFPLTVYANGNNTVNEGYLSIIFRGFRINIKQFEFSCFVAVLDVAGNKKFLQSFSFSYNSPRLPPLTEEYWPVFGIDKYIERATLLREPSEFLPDDTLTLHVEIIVVRKLEIQYMCYMDSKMVKSSFKTDEDGDCIRHYLLLDSVIGRYLRMDSSYFNLILESSMKEAETRYIHIPAEEYPVFLQIASIIIGATLIEVESIDDIFQLLAFADKYDIPFVTENCFGLLKSYLDYDKAADIVTLAGEYFDGFDHLKESIKGLLRRTDEKTEFIRNELQFKERRLTFHWNCEIMRRDSKNYLVFRKEDNRFSDTVELNPVNESPAFDFYS